MRILSFATTMETRLVHLESNHRSGGSRLERNSASSPFPLPQYPSSPEEISAFLKARHEDEAGNKDHRETQVGNAILDFLAARGSKERLLEIAAHARSEGELDASDQTRNQLTDLLAQDSADQVTA